MRHTPAEATPTGDDADGGAEPPVRVETEGSETVVHRVPTSQWGDAIADEVTRFGSVAVGPGVGRDSTTVDAVRAVASMDGFPLLIDGDGLNALGPDSSSILSQRTSPTVLTPHDREFERLTGSAPDDDRSAAARVFAIRSGSVVLLKGPTTIVADPLGRVLLSNSGDDRLAAAGTGDVLSGMIAAHLAMGMDATLAAAAASFVHGRAAGHCHRFGLVASDLVAALPAVYSELLA